MSAYDRLLEHECVHCEDENVFRNFIQLREHVQRVHQMFFCDLCVEHHQLFTKDRRTYTREDLATHRRKGDSNDKSHRGHPLCDYCDMRYLDRDELFKHLRKDHFFCHFCDIDGKQEFYTNYDELRQHFTRSHFLCEEGRCKNEQFTNAFRHKLDFQAHILEKHAETKEARQHARQVELQFEFPTRENARGPNFRSVQRPAAAQAVEEPPPQPTNIDFNCVQDFPTLGNF